MTISQQNEGLDAILQIAQDLTSSLHSENRYGRLLAAICRVFPCDAACLLSVEGDTLVPLAARGLSRAALSKNYPRAEHPRLDALIGSLEPVRFPPDVALPDPFDGLVAGLPHALGKVHDCMGCALTEHDEVVGVLTLDAFEPGAFDRVDRKLLATLAALAGATLRTIGLVNALEKKAEQQSRIAKEIGRTPGSRLIGESSALRAMRQEIEMVAPTALPLLISGETGSGKDVVAQLVHESSTRAGEPWVHLNCAALPENLAESELFGHAPGAFTGAARARAGKFEAADKGTLFLDEIGELPLPLQAKLLIVLQNGQIQRLGSERSVKVDVRVIAATNRDLQEEVRKGRFREDLFHRLSSFSIRVAPLRERSDDIPLLAEHFVKEARRKLGIGPTSLSESCLPLLQSMQWPGNVRELQNALTRAALRAAHSEPAGSSISITERHFDAPQVEPSSSQVPPVKNELALRERVKEFQRQQITAALKQHEGSIAATARSLGMHRSNLHHLMVRLGISTP